MGTISRGSKSAGGTNFTSSTTILASEVNTDLNTIYSEFNGNIENSNVKAGAAIAASKLNLASITENVTLTGAQTIVGSLTTDTLTADTLVMDGGTSSTTITQILDEDTMTSDSATALATQQSIKAYVDNGSVKGWVNYDASSGTPTVQDSYNVDSITDNGAGDHTVNWDTDFANTNYCVVGMTEDDAIMGTPVALTAGATRVRTRTRSAGTLTDFTRNFVLAIGDQ